MISLLLVILRFTGIYNSTEITRFFILVILFIYIYFLSKNQIYKVDFIIKFFTYILFYGILLGLLNYNNLRYILSESLVIITAILSYMFFYNIKTENIDKSINKFSYFILFIQSFVTYSGLILKITYFKAIYLSLTDPLILIPLIWFLITKKNKLLLYTIFLILIGGKTGILLSALVVYLIYKIFSLKINILKTFLYILFSLFLFITFLYGISNLEITSNNIFTSIFMKFQSYNPFNIFLNGEFDLNKLSNFGGGRVQEIIYSIKTIIEQNEFFILTGKGLGYEYYIPKYDMTIHNVHFTPVSLITKFGIIITLFIYFIFIVYLINIYKSLIKQKSKNENYCNKFFFYLIISMSIYSFTAYTFFMNLLLWFSLAYLTRQLKNKEYICVE